MSNSAAWRMISRWPALIALVISLTILVDAASILMAGDRVGFAIIVGSGLFGGIAVPLAMIRWVVPARARRLHARSHLLRAPVVLDADATAVRFAGPDAEIRIPWAELVGWREDANTILLYTSRAHFHIVPQRALASGARDELRRLYDACRTPGRSAGVVSIPDEKHALDARPADASSLAVSETWFVTRADLVAAQRLHLHWLWRQPRAFVTPLLLAACAGLVVVITDPGATWGYIVKPMLGAVLLVAALRAVSYGLLPLGARNFRRLQPNLALPWRVELDAQGLRALTPQQDVRTAWGDYIAWAEDTRVVLVYRSDAVFQFLPMRALDAVFLGTFRGLVAALPQR